MTKKTEPIVEKSTEETYNKVSEKKVASKGLKLGRKKSDHEEY